jgi:hypothetical protein
MSRDIRGPDLLYRSANPRHHFDSRTGQREQRVIAHRAADHAADPVLTHNGHSWLQGHGQLNNAHRLV